jgi:hypothetical protein
MNTEDYTRLKSGTKVDGGEIKLCGLAGLAETSGTKEFFTHSQTTGLDESGAPMVKWVMHEHPIEQP